VPCRACAIVRSSSFSPVEPMARTMAVAAPMVAKVQAARRRVSNDPLRTGSSTATLVSQPSRMLMPRIVTSSGVVSARSRAIGVRMSSGQCQR
jgi:hypothetical protein